MCKKKKHVCMLKNMLSAYMHTISCFFHTLCKWLHSYGHMMCREAFSLVTARVGLYTTTKTIEIVLKFDYFQGIEEQAWKTMLSNTLLRIN